MADKSDSTVTDLLHRWTGGDESAQDELIARVYDELQKIARSYFSREPQSHTLETRVVIDEALMQLIGKKQQLEFVNRTQFYALAAQVMRHFLKSYGRTRRAQKRWDGLSRAPEAELLKLANDRIIDVDRVVDVEDALQRLEERYSRPAKIIELRYYGGLTLEEVSTYLEISLATVKRDYETARKWLARELADHAPKTVE